MRSLTLATTLALTTGTAHADQWQAEAQALDHAKREIAFRSVAGPGNQTPQLAAYLKQQLVAGGFRSDDVTITPVDHTAYPIARWPGTDATARPLVVEAIRTAMAPVYPGVPIFPSMAAGASDSMWFRYHHVPSYGASPVFIKDSDNFSHGLNERTPVANIAPAIRYYLSLFTTLSK